MKLNAKKCKQLQICFLKEDPQLLPLIIDGDTLETVQSHKALGLIIQNNLKCDEQIFSSVTKASKRLCYIASVKVQFFCLLIGQKRITCRSAKRHV